MEEQNQMFRAYKIFESFFKWKLKILIICNDSLLILMSYTKKINNKYINILHIDIVVHIHTDITMISNKAKYFTKQIIFNQIHRFIKILFYELLNMQKLLLL